MEEILGALEDIANLIGRCALYETLYLGKQTMAARCEQVIVELYVSILLYLLGAKKYYSKNTTGTSHDCMHSKAAANGSVQCVLWPAHLIRRCSRFWMRLRKRKGSFSRLQLLLRWNVSLFCNSHLLVGWVSLVLRTLSVLGLPGLYHKAGIITMTTRYPSRVVPAD